MFYIVDKVFDRSGLPKINIEKFVLMKFSYNIFFISDILSTERYANLMWYELMAFGIRCLNIDI